MSQLRFYLLELKQQEMKVWRKKNRAVFPKILGVNLAESSAALLVIQVREHTCPRLCQSFGFCGPAAIFAPSLYMPFHS